MITSDIQPRENLFLRDSEFRTSLVSETKLIPIADSDQDAYPKIMHNDHSISISTPKDANNLGMKANNKTDRIHSHNQKHTYSQFKDRSPTQRVFIQIEDSNNQPELKSKYFSTPVRKAHVDKSVESITFLSKSILERNDNGTIQQHQQNERILVANIQNNESRNADSRFHSYPLEPTETMLEVLSAQATNTTKNLFSTKKESPKVSKIVHHQPKSLKLNKHIRGVKRRTRFGE